MEYGGEKVSGMRQETKEKYEEIYKLYLAGKSKKEISIESHCAYSTIDRAMREHGVIFSRENFAKHKDEILAMYKSGRTYQEIAEATGLNESTISRNLRYILFAKDKEEHRRRRDKKERAQEAFRAAAEQEEEEIVPRQYAKNWRRERQIVANGKVYTDITDWFM